MRTPVVYIADAECRANGLMFGCVVVRIVFSPMLSTFSMILIERRALRSSRERATLFREGRLMTVVWVGLSTSDCDVNRLRKMSAPDASRPDSKYVSGDGGRWGDPSVKNEKIKHI